MGVLLFLLACQSNGTDSTATPPPSDTETGETVDSGVPDTTDSGTSDTADSGASDTADSGGSFECNPSVWTSDRYDMDHDGIERGFRVHVPANHDPTVPAPLVMVFHGWGGSDSEFLSSAQVTAEADARGYIVIAPTGLGAGAPDRSWASWSFRGSTTGLDGDGLNPEVAGDSTDICDDAATTDYAYDSCAGVAQNGCSWTHCQDDDVDFVLDLVALAAENLCIDPNRVFAVGGSNGGMFSWELGQNEASADTFRAIAPLIGLPHRGHLDPPASSGGMPVMLITGKSDRTVPPGEWDDPSYTTTTDGDVYYYTGATAITQVWAEAQGCDVTVPAAVVDVGVSDVECRSHCADGDPWPSVMDCRAEMGHSYRLGWAWPLILDFFDQHQ